MPNTHKEKGDLLESIIEQFCGGINNAKVSRNIFLRGKNSKSDREIDVLIEGVYGIFDVKIVVESKNHKDSVGVEIVESFSTKLKDVGADLGVMVCPSGFTSPAKETAEALNIQLFEVFDKALNNTDLFIPLRYVDPNITGYKVQFASKALDNHFEIPLDNSRWLFEFKNRTFNINQAVIYAWNNDLIPQTKGEHVADFGVVLMKDVENPNNAHYIELKLVISVEEDFYLKLFPASFVRKFGTKKENHNLFIDLYSDSGKFEKNGWIKYPTMEEMNKAADIDNQPPGIRELILRTHSTMEPEK